MKKCPIKLKTSDLHAQTRGKQLGKPKYLSPSELADLQGCSERTIREWCKQGLIPEAYQTHGSHWRIPMPLPIRTRYELDKRRDDWPFDDNARDLQGDFASDLVESLMLAQVYGVGISSRTPAPTRAELGDLLEDGLIKPPTSKKARLARKIQDEIILRVKNRKSFWDLLLIGWVFQFWLKNKRRPTIAEIAKLMGLSRPAFYRRYPNARRKVDKAYFVASNESKRELPDPDGLDPVQRANRNAKKPTFATLQRDLYSDD